MIYLYAPFYRASSYGVSVIYELGKILARGGYDIKALCVEDERYDIDLPDDIRPIYVSKALLPRKINDDDIVIYFDTTNDNQLKAKNAVYWLLNKPGALTGQEIDFHPTDLLVAFSTLVHAELPQLFVMKDERALFDKLRKKCIKKKNTVSVYFGKVRSKTIAAHNDELKKLIDKYTTVHVITRGQPAERTAALQMVAESDLLISYDPLSNINYEATLLGTPVLLMDDVYQLEKIKYNVHTPGYAFRPSGIPAARNHIQEVYKAYCEWLENQETQVISQIEWIIAKLKQLREDEQAVLENQRVNEKAKADFCQFYTGLTEPITNIDFPEQLPKETSRILRLIGRARIETPPPATGPVAATSSSVAVKTKRVKPSWLTKAYLGIKPSWANSMYRKLPGDLTIRELCFLLFRRATIRFKK